MNMCYLFIYLPNNYTTKVLRVGLPLLSSTFI